MNKKQLSAYLLIFLGINQLVAGQPKDVQSTPPQTSAAQTVVGKPTRFETLRKKIAQGIKDFKKDWQKHPFFFSGMTVLLIVVAFYESLYIGQKSRELQRRRNLALWHVARQGHPEAIEPLLNQGAQIGAEGGNDHSTPLHQATCATRNNLAVGEVLLKHGAPVGAQDTHGHTPLHDAAGFGRKDMAALLLKHGAPLAAQTSHGFTPLHEAAGIPNLPHFQAIELLLDHGAPVGAQDKNGRTPLHITAGYRPGEFGGHVDDVHNEIMMWPNVVDMLLDKQFKAELKLPGAQDEHDLVKKMLQMNTAAALTASAGSANREQQ